MRQFLHVPRTGGTSILLSGYGGYIGHAYARDLVAHGVSAPHDLVGGCRNPFERAVSLVAVCAGAHYVRQPGRAGQYRQGLPVHVFRDWLRSEQYAGLAPMRRDLGGVVVHAWLWAPASTWLQVPGFGLIDHIRHERYCADVRDKLGLEVCDVHHASNRCVPWQAYYDGRARDQIARLFAPDFELLGYSPDLYA